MRWPQVWLLSVLTQFPCHSILDIHSIPEIPPFPSDQNCEDRVSVPRARVEQTQPPAPQPLTSPAVASSDCPGAPLPLFVKPTSSSHATGGHRVSFSFFSWLLFRCRRHPFRDGGDNDADNRGKDAADSKAPKAAVATRTTWGGGATSTSAWPKCLPSCCPLNRPYYVTETLIPDQEPPPILCCWGFLLLFLICFVGPLIYIFLLQTI